MNSSEPMHSATLRVGCHSLRVVVQPGDAAGSGEGALPPLVLLSGIGANLELFDPFIEALNRVHGAPLRTIRFDVPGVGGSSASLWPYRMRHLARLLARLLDQLEVPRVDVLGISWGGALAQQFAHQYAPRCRRLILGATSTGSLSVPGRPAVLAKLLSPRRYFQPSYRAQIGGALYGGRFRREPGLMQHYAHLFRAPGGLGYTWQLLASAGWTSLPWLHRIRQPVLILAGDDDPIIPLANAHILARQIPQATLHVLHDGHMFLLTEANQVAPLVHRFLTQA